MLTRILKANIPVLCRLYLYLSLVLDYDDGDDTIALKPFQEHKLRSLHPLFTDLICPVLARDCLIVQSQSKQDNL
jgi:hypothetical protein